MAYRWNDLAVAQERVAPEGEIGRVIMLHFQITPSRKQLTKWWEAEALGGMLSVCSFGHPNGQSGEPGLLQRERWAT